MAWPVRKIMGWQFGVVAVLLLAHLFSGGGAPLVQKMVDIDLESNLPTWYSTVLLFSVSLSAWAIARGGAGPAPSREYWLFFCVFYGFLSLDEGACLHEFFTRTTTIKWVFLYAPLAAVFYLVCAFHLIRSGNRRLCLWILGGLGLYALGGLLGEYISYRFRPLPPGWQQFEFVWEEGLEMIGTVLVLTGCLEELDRRGTAREAVSAPPGAN